MDPAEVALENEMLSTKILWIGFGMRAGLAGKGYGLKCAEYAIFHFNYKGKYVGLGVYTFNIRGYKST